MVFIFFVEPAVVMLTGIMVAIKKIRADRNEKKLKVLSINIHLLN